MLTRPRIILAAALAAFLVAASPASPAPPTVERPVRSCFPASLWSLPSKSRPCSTLGYVHEDGSGYLTLTGYGYRVRCLIPNPAEERRSFRMRCHRIGGTR